jgi:hypothetical protein
MSSLTRAEVSGFTRRATQAKLCPFQARGNLLLGGLRVIAGRYAPARPAHARRLLVVDLGGHGVDGVHLHGHGQLAQVAVVEYAAARSYLKGALLLLAWARSMKLRGEQPEARRGGTQSAMAHEQKEQADKPEARPLERHHARRGVVIPAGSDGGRHGQSLRDSLLALTIRSW